MLFLYTITFFIAMGFYFLGFNVIAGVIIIALAIFLYLLEVERDGRLITIRGLFLIGFVGGFGLSLFKLSKLSAPYSVTTFFVVFVAYYSLYFGAFLADKKKRKELLLREPLIITNDDILPQDIIVAILVVVTLIAFIIEVIILKFIPIFTVNVPHAYSTFHVFGVHYITTLYVFIPSLALCNYLVCPDKNRIIELVFSYVYALVMSVLLVSRMQLIVSLLLTVFIFIIYKKDELTLEILKKNYKTILIVIFGLIGIFIIITISRSHSISYLKSIFEMKSEKMPIFISQPYMYVAHNFENLNYMINNIFRFTFGRRILYPLFTLTFIKKLFPIVADSPYYIIKPELSTVTIVYDFYYDFGIVGVIFFCFIIGYFGQLIENETYKKIKPEFFHRNNYIVILFSYLSYFMLFSFFQTYFSLTDTWVFIIFLSILILTVRMKKNYGETKKTVYFIKEKSNVAKKSRGKKK